MRTDSLFQFKGKLIEESSNIKNVMNIFDDIIHEFLLKWVNYVDPNTADGDLGDIFNIAQAHELHILENGIVKINGVKKNNIN
jgi:hypothetical protein